MAEAARPPWYGGNKIPASYLAKFSLPRDPEQDDMPADLRAFLSSGIVADTTSERKPA